MDRKVQPRFYDGFKFLRKSDLPAQQASLFEGWVGHKTADAIPADIRRSQEDIIQYDDYDFWFDYHYLVEKDLDELL